jgi:circadian clock protein KaiB
MQKNRQGKHDSSVDTDEDVYVLRLYVTGASPNSMRAIINTRNLCEEYLRERYDLEIIDVYQQPEIAKHENIIALPMLVKKFPLPEKRLIGDLSDIKKVLNSIGLSNKDQ